MHLQGSCSRMQKEEERVHKVFRKSSGSSGESKPNANRRTKIVKRTVPTEKWLRFVFRLEMLRERHSTILMQDMRRLCTNSACQVKLRRGDICCFALIRSEVCARIVCAPRHTHRHNIHSQQLTKRKPVTSVRRRWRWQSVHSFLDKCFCNIMYLCMFTKACETCCYTKAGSQSRH